MMAILSVPDKTFRELSIRWFANSGPFSEDERTSIAEDLFYFELEDVTDQGLGEAARRLLVGSEAGVFSFLNAGEPLAKSPLRISQGLLEDTLATLEVTNATTVGEFYRDWNEQINSWSSLLTSATQTCDSLIFSREIETQLKPEPFSASVARRALELVGILQQIAAHTDDAGALDETGLELLQNHFVGDKCAFTDESDGNKRDFKNEMTFRDPVHEEKKLFCPWHGKIKVQQFRIHFEWPRPKGQKTIKVLYVGPKITKR